MKEVAGTPAATPILQGKRRHGKVSRMTTNEPNEPTVQQYIITDGPTNSDHIWDAAKYSQDKDGAKVSFKTNQKLKNPDGTGDLEDWLVLTPNITGVRCSGKSGDTLLLFGYLNERQISGHFIVSSRKGLINVHAR